MILIKKQGQIRFLIQNKSIQNYSIIVINNLKNLILFLKCIIHILVIFAFNQTAFSRVFDINKESFAAYLRGQYALAQQGDIPFAPSSGSGTTFSDSYSYNLAYEFGFVYATRFVNWRFGFEVIKPTDLRGIKGTNSTGSTDYYTVTNTISAYIPKIGLEFNLKNWSASRIYASVDYGMATANVQNSYTFTAAGSTQYPTPGADFREEVVGTGTSIESSLGFETLLSDTTTVVLEGGYRTLEINGFKHNVDATTFRGAVSKGDQALNADGSERSLSLSGGYAALVLRIWIK